MSPSLPPITEKGIIAPHGESHAGFFCLLNLRCAEQKENSWGLIEVRVKIDRKDPATRLAQCHRWEGENAGVMTIERT